MIEMSELTGEGLVCMYVFVLVGAVFYIDIKYLYLRAAVHGVAKSRTRLSD